MQVQGYKLTDEKDPVGGWTFPAITIAAGQYILVALDGKNLSGAATVGITAGSALLTGCTHGCKAPSNTHAAGGGHR